MKVCNTCNATIDDNLTYCPNCGSHVPSGYPMHYGQTSTEPVSVGGWIGRSLIPFIPVVGAIVYLIMLFIWSGDTKKEETSRNWAKAQLILMAIALVFTILMVILFFTVFAEVLNSL